VTKAYERRRGEKSDAGLLSVARATDGKRLSLFLHETADRAC